MNSYVLDTSALFTYMDNEKGADEIERIIQEGYISDIQIFLSVVSLIEVFYATCQEKDESIAKERIEFLMNKPFTIVDLDISMTEIIGSIKAKHQLSFADSCIAGLAKIKNATLVHKDPEFEAITEIPQYILPYKKEKSK